MSRRREGEGRNGFENGPFACGLVTAHNDLREIGVSSESKGAEIVLDIK